MLDGGYEVKRQALGLLVSRVKVMAVAEGRGRCIDAEVTSAID